MSDEKKEQRGIGFLGWLILISLAFVGLWVVAGNVFEWAKPWWRYASIASIAFTAGTFYGRYRRDTKKPKQP